MTASLLASLSMAAAEGLAGLALIAWRSGPRQFKCDCSNQHHDEMRWPDTYS